MIGTVIGIPDPWIWMAYLLCLAATVLCVVHGAVRGRKGDIEPSPADRTWVEHEKKVAEED